MISTVKFREVPISANITNESVADRFNLLTSEQSARLIAFLEYTTLGTVIVKRISKSNFYWFMPPVWWLGQIGLKHAAQKLDAWSEERFLQLQTADSNQNRTYLKYLLCESARLKVRQINEFHARDVHQLVDAVAPVFGVNAWDLPRSTKVREFCNALLSDISSKVSDALRGMSDEKLHEIAKTIVRDAMASNEQERSAMHDVLGVEELTIQTVKKALPQLSIVALSGSIFSAANFAPYVALTKIMSIVVTGGFGVTLPFAVYTTATSALSFAFEPITLIILGGLIVFRTYRKSARDFQKRIAGYVLLSVALLPDPPASHSRNRQLRRRRLAAYATLGGSLAITAAGEVSLSLDALSIPTTNTLYAHLVFAVLAVAGVITSALMFRSARRLNQ